MKSKSTSIKKQNNNLVYIALGTALILSIPLIAMQFSEEWDWKLGDFIIMGTLIFGTGLLLNLVMTRVRNNMHRLVLGIAVLMAFFLIWAELAVGIFDSPLAGS